jgi:hypothetical protein
MRLVLGLAIVSVALVGGCRQSDEKVKAELRTQMMQRCTTDIAPQAAAVPGFDAPKFCTCVTDKAIGDRSVAELKKMFEDKASTAAKGREAGKECLSQQMPNGVPAQAGTAPADPKAATPVTPGQAASGKAKAAGDVDEEIAEDGAEDSQ